MSETWEEQQKTITPEPYDVQEKLVRNWIRKPQVQEGEDDRVDDTLTVFRDNRMYESLNDASKAEKAVFWWMLYDLAKLMPPTGIRVAVIGAGLCKLPKALWLRYPTLDIYELRQKIIDKATEVWGGAGEIGENWTWIQGDYKDTLPASGKTYHAIFFDLDGEPEIDLAPYLTANGKLFKSADYYDKVRYLP